MSIPIPAFDAARVIVVGDLMLDRYWHGATSRISPEAPVPVVRVGAADDRPGGAGNVALNIAALGAQSTLIAVTGDDAPADELEATLTRVGVRCHFQRLAGVPTVMKLRVVSRHQQLIRLDFEAGLAGFAPDVLRDQVAGCLANADALVLSDYQKGTLQASAALIELANAAGVPVVVDPKSSDFSNYRGATLVTPNQSEFETAVGPCPDQATLVDKAHELIDRHQLGAILVTQGERGMTLMRPGHPAESVPARAREVYDVTGAGDTVVAAIACALAAGQPLMAAVELANFAAGLVVAKLGTATVTVDELRRASAQAGQPTLRILDEHQLLTAVNQARSAGEKIVMTNGCFDLLHAGHVHYLEQARPRRPAHRRRERRRLRAPPERRG